MKQILLPVLCAVAALSLFTPNAQAQTPSAGGLHRRGAAGIDQRAREIIAKFDKDGDHALNVTELTAFFESLRERREEHHAQQASNPSPSTSTPGTSSTTGQHHAGSPQEHAAKAIKKFDKNGDGKLEAGEIVAMLTALREHMLQHKNATPSQATTPSNTSSSTGTAGNAIKL